MNELIDELIEQGHLKTPHIIAAFRAISRRNFVPDELVGDESVDTPLPIGHGQTISQPTTVAIMLELLQPKAGQNVLDVGSGSGWTTALLAEIVGKQGFVHAIERMSELKEMGERNAAKYEFTNTKFYAQDGSEGLPESAPFDRILVSAAAMDIPQPLKDQLKPGGRMVIPTVQDDLHLIVRRLEDGFDEEVIPGFVFVPLIVD